MQLRAFLLDSEAHRTQPRQPHLYPLIASPYGRSLRSPADLERFFSELVDLGGVTKAAPEVLMELCGRYQLEIDLAPVLGLIERFGVRFGGEGLS